MIPAPDFCRLPDFSAAAHKPEIKLVILVSHKFFVKQSNFIENLTGPAAKINRIDRAGVLLIMPAGSSDGKRRLKRGRNRPTHPSFSPRHPGATHVVSGRLPQNFDALTDIIWSVPRVRVDADDDSTSS